MIKRRTWVTLGSLALVALLAYIGIFWLRPRVRHEYIRAKLAEQLASSDSAERIEAAWRFVDAPEPDIETRIAGGLMGDEKDPEVREAFAGALGRFGQVPEISTTRRAALIAPLRHVIDLDPSGEVRAAAWLAVARIDRAAFDAIRDEKGAAADPWDQIGQAQARLQLNDMSGVLTLLHFAGHGETAERVIASKAVFKNLRPLLDSVGRWPIEATQREGEAYPAALADEIARRCQGLDLAMISRDIAQHSLEAERIKRTIRRLTGGRERIARFISAPTEPDDRDDN